VLHFNFWCAAITRRWVANLTERFPNGSTESGRIWNLERSHEFAMSFKVVGSGGPGLPNRESFRQASQDITSPKIVNHIAKPWLAHMQKQPGLEHCADGLLFPKIRLLVLPVAGGPFFQIVFNLGPDYI